MNRAIICGRLGKDPELRETRGGAAVANFSVATTDREKKGDKWEEVTDWHSVVAFGKMAENCSKYLTKGREVLVEGKMRTSSWEDQSGNRRYKTEIVASNVQFIGGKPQGYEKREDGVETRTRSRGGSSAENSQGDYHGNDGQFDAPGTSGLDDIPF